MKQLSDFEKACVKQALDKLLNDRHFSICAFDNIGEMLGVNVSQHPNYVFLNGLHCVDYNKMSAEIRNNLEAKMLECLRPSTNFSADRLFGAVMAEGGDWIDAEDFRAVGSTKEKPKRGLLNLIKS